MPEPLTTAIDAYRNTDLVMDAALCYVVGYHSPRQIVLALQRRGIVPRQDQEHPDLETMAVIEEVGRQVQDMVAWPSKTEVGRRFWQEVDAARQEGNEARWVGKVALKTMARSLETVLELASPANEDKRTRTSNAQFHLGSLGFSPTQKHEVTASDDLLRLQREIFGPAPEKAE